VRSIEDNDNARGNNAAGGDGGGLAPEANTDADLLPPSASAATTGTTHTSIRTSGTTRMTYDGSNGGVSCGLADFVAQEEMDRFRGFWWSPDSSMIAYTKVRKSRVRESECEGD
jgi:dipeptidyl-peptidase 4